MADLAIVNLTAEPGVMPGSVLLRYDIEGDIPANATIRVARDGTDTRGTGAWKTFIGAEQRRFTFTLLKSQIYTFTVSVKDGDATLVSQEIAMAPTDVPAPAPAPTKNAVTNVRATGLPGGKVKIDWDVQGTPTSITVARSGVDTSGHGAWTGLLTPTTKTFTFTALKGTYTFSVTPQGGETVTVKAQPADEPVKVDPPKPTPGPVTPPKPGDANATFKAFTVGHAVSDAANGNFNKWVGKRAGLYATWGADGKVWAIDTARSEYGTDAVTRLGDFDLDIAPMRKNGGWSNAANGGLAATWKKDLTELKQKWGNRQGHVHYRQWHELNGNWYEWSVTSRDDQDKMRKAARILRDQWDDVFQGDKRFHLELSPNRDSKYGLDLRNCWVDGVFDELGPDYYDFGVKPGGDWNGEKDKTQNGGSPVGVNAYIKTAKEWGVPLIFPEFGIQYGDNDTFLNGVLPILEANAYSGTGDPAGKVLGIAWHNLRNKANAIETGAGGDFFITDGGGTYSKRPKSSAIYREWVKRVGWRTV